MGEVELVADLSQHFEYHSGVLEELPIVVSHEGGPGRILNRAQTVIRDEKLQDLTLTSIDATGILLPLKFPLT